jgi:hypothetical protein
MRLLLQTYLVSNLSNVYKCLYDLSFLGCVYLSRVGSDEFLSIYSNLIKV